MARALHSHCPTCAAAARRLSQVLGADAINRGQPALLLNGVDHRGRICGFDRGVHDKPLWALVSWSGAGLCVKECPEKNNYNEVTVE